MRLISSSQQLLELRDKVYQQERFCAIRSSEQTPHHVQCHCAILQTFFFLFCVRRKSCKVLVAWLKQNQGFACLCTLLGFYADVHGVRWNSQFSLSGRINCCANSWSSKPMEALQHDSPDFVLLSWGFWVFRIGVKHLSCKMAPSFLSEWLAHCHGDTRGPLARLPKKSHESWHIILE